MAGHITHPASESATPLVVDVEGALVGGDLLMEGAAHLLAASPLKFFGLLFRLVIGGSLAALKRRIAQEVPLAPATLVLNPAVLDAIAAAKAAGREVWLASGADELAVAPLVQAVGAAGCLASDGRVNLAGEAKARALVERFGAGGFDYVGNKRRDLAAWKCARRTVGVGLPAHLARQVRADKDAQFLPGFGRRPRDYFRALRPHQWVKNLLAFTPLIAAHETGAYAYLAATGMFVALSACASGAYLLNDLLDLPQDRRHASKRCRPLAAGKVALPSAMGLAAVLGAAGVVLAFRLSWPGGLCVLLYLILTLAYSLSLKRKLFVDVVTLGVLYMVRVFAGGVAVSVTLSPWFLAFFMFAFLSLATVKRQGELRRLRKAGGTAVQGRGWRTEDLPVLTAYGAAANLCSVIVLALYIRSPEVSALYSRPEFLWLICPLLVYWLGRMTLLANRGAVDDDPVVFTLRDRTSWLTGLATAAAFAAAF